MQSNLILKARRRRIQALNTLHAKRAVRSADIVMFRTSRIDATTAVFAKRTQTKIISLDMPLAA